MLRLACVMPSDRGKLLVEVGESISAVEADLERYRTRDALSSLLLDLAPWAKVKPGKITVSFD
jgi:hypothetical protein